MKRTIGFSFAYGIVAITGLIGNTVVLLVIVRNNVMRNATDAFIAHLAVSDIMLIIFTTPVLLLVEISNDISKLGELFPKVSAGVGIFCAITSSYTVLAIAVERFFAIVHPLKQLTRNKRITIIISLVLIWTCALSQLVVRHTVTVFRNEQFNQTSRPYGSTYACNETHKSKYYFIIIFLFYNVFPLVVVFYLYTRIIIKLKSRDKELKQKYSKRSSQDDSAIVNHAKNQRKIVIMLLIVPIVLVVCEWPFTILHIKLTYAKHGCMINADLLTNSVFRILAFLPTALNPIIYNVFSEKFRTGFRQVFSNICRRKL